jgi:hypothetical protein|tara:strand:- start:147 stop:755 length:609 start_codon:yes stop_codon:yes gene_type:complete
VKKFTVALLSVIFVALITCSIQSISADHESGEGIFKDRSEVDLVTTHDSDYQVYLQAVLRNGDGQLINVTETMATGAYIPHEITDYVFDTLMGKKEIVIIDNVKYEKVQYTFSPTLEQRWIGMYPIFEEVPIKIKVEGLAKDEVFNVTKDHALWKIHYCADFSSIGHHGLQCIPIFQVLVPTITLEPGDVVTHQWTILRVMN